MKRWWVSWYWRDGSEGPFELHCPWWITGETDDASTVCAAVLAEDEEAARKIILDSYDVNPGDLDWRFVDERPDDWSPFGDRFRRAQWMQWPGV